MTRLKNNMAASRNVDVTKITIKCPFFFYWGFNVSFGVGLETGSTQALKTSNTIPTPTPTTAPDCRTQIPPQVPSPLTAARSCITISMVMC